MENGEWWFMEIGNSSRPDARRSRRRRRRFGRCRVSAVNYSSRVAKKRWLIVRRAESVAKKRAEVSGVAYICRLETEKRHPTIRPSDRE